VIEKKNKYYSAVKLLKIFRNKYQNKLIYMTDTTSSVSHNVLGCELIVLTSASLIDKACLSAYML